MPETGMGSLRSFHVVTLHATKYLQLWNLLNPECRATFPNRDVAATMARPSGQNAPVMFGESRSAKPKPKESLSISAENKVRWLFFGLSWSILAMGRTFRGCWDRKLVFRGLVNQLLPHNHPKIKGEFRVELINDQTWNRPLKLFQLGLLFGKGFTLKAISWEKIYFGGRVYAARVGLVLGGLDEHFSKIINCLWLYLSNCTARSWYTETGGIDGVSMTFRWRHISK